MEWVRPRARQVAAHIFGMLRSPRMWRLPRARRVGRSTGPVARMIGPALIAAALAVPSAAAQQGGLTGRVWSDDRIPVAGVLAVLASEADTTRTTFAETDRLGYFIFRDLEAGAYILTINQLGFGEFREQVTVTAGEAIEIEVALERQALQLEGLRVDAQRSRVRARFEETAGVTVQEIELDELKSIPGIAESDPLRAIEVLPGVTTVSDFSAAFNVRGGSADQNLILLDDIPIYNPFHLGNLFSVFNADMVGRAELRAGGFPAEYGGRVSSLLTVESDTGDGETSVDAGISILASRVAVDGKLPDSFESALGLATSRWRVSGRRSYLDILVSPFADFPYYLGDLQGVFEGWTPGGDRLRLTGYTGRDVLDLTNLEDAPFGVNWRWGNDAAGGSWTNLMRGGGSMGLRAAWSRFTSDFRFADFDAIFANRVERATLDAYIERRPTSRIRWKSGLTASRREYDNYAVAAGATFDDDEGRGTELGAFSQIHWESGGGWLLESGLRLDQWRPEPGDVVTTLSPRFALKRFLRNRSAAIRLSAGRYTQFIHSLRDEEFPLGFDIWVLAGQQAPHVRSDQIQLGVESLYGEDDAWFASLEGYYRTFDGVITLNAAENPGDPLDDFVAGDGTAWGVDLFLRRELGETTGWIALSFLRTDRTFPETRIGTSPYPLVTYPPVFDRRLDIDLVLRRSLNWWGGVVAGIRANFGTGLPFTRPLGTYRYHTPQLIDGRLDGEYETAVVLGARNGERYPSRHRLDFSLRKTIERDWGTMTPYLSIINVYNQRNVLFYFFEYDESPPQRRGVSMIPILPTFGMEISF